jgi:hypothetical protein
MEHQVCRVALSDPASRNVLTEPFRVKPNRAKKPA